MSIARNWLHECQKSHPDCTLTKASYGLEKSPLPTRVIDVMGPEISGMIKISMGSGLLGQFAALSHRWVSGEMPQWVPTQKILHQRMAGFPLHDLPRPLVDAVSVTRKLGLRYLWVDLVCIIQDSAPDWNVESSRMVDVYAGAFFTLFADCASDDDAGFLNVNRSLSPPPILIRLRSGQFSSLPVYVRYSDASIPMWKQPTKGHLYTTNVGESVLSDRAWILQERVMSRRILHFGKNQMFWECRTTTLAEYGHLVGQDRARKWLIQSHQVNSDTPLTDLEVHLRWAKLVQEYTQRRLTKSIDKLPALSSIAKIFGSRTKDKYHAGLWRNSFHHDLLWQSKIHDPDQLPWRPPEYRAPSWSWASVNCAVYVRANSEPEDFELKPAFDIIDVHTDAASEDGFGQVRGGSATLSGPLQAAISMGPYEKQIGDTDKV
jgi:Heterokaryon incompatibility protein (HET)